MTKSENWAAILTIFIQNATKLKTPSALSKCTSSKGPVLSGRGIDIGIVGHIAAPYRLRITVEGTAAHSGACPMDSRRDALTGAAEVILAVEKLGRQYADRRIVSHCGQMQCYQRRHQYCARPGRIICRYSRH